MLVFLVYQKHFDEDDIVEGIMKAIGECKDDKVFSSLLSQICQPLAKNLLDLYEKYEKGLSGESHEQFNKVVFSLKSLIFFFPLHLETLLRGCLLLFRQAVAYYNVIFFFR